MNKILTLFFLCVAAFQSAAAQTAKNPSTPGDAQLQEKIDVYMNAAASVNKFSGTILIARDGSPVVSRGYGMANYEWNLPNTPQTVFRIASLAKQFTAMTVMILHERGKLNTGDPICKYLENCPAAWQSITVRHLLNHTSGIPNYVRLPDFEKKLVHQPYTYASFVEIFRSEPLDFAPGEKFNYSNSGYFLLGLIVERASGKSYADFLRENIFAPLEMKSSGYDDQRTLIPGSADGYQWTGKSFVRAPYLNMLIPFAAGALYSTTEDLLRWDQALYTEKIVSRKSLDEIFTPSKGEYGYGWGIKKKFNRLAHEHDGGLPSGFTSAIVRFPEERATIIVLSNNNSVISMRIANTLAAILFGEPYQVPKPPVSEALAPVIEQKGIEAAVAQFRELKRAESGKYDFAEPVLNKFGYDLLGAKRIKEAIEIFKLNAEMFPQSGNVYDSLGEAYMLAGDKHLAVKNYEKSLELDPKNANAVEMLKKLRGGK